MESETMNASLNAIPNPETKAALEEIEEMRAHPEKYKSYASFQELLDEVLHDN